MAGCDKHQLETVRLDCEAMESNMNIENLRKCTDWFRVAELKDIADPSGQVARKELIVPLDQYPYDFGLGPNPREPDPTSRVSKRIGETLKTEWGNFHLLDRGVVVVA